MLLAAAEPGLHLGDVYVLGLAFLGLAVFAAIGALSNQEERAFSAALIYLGSASRLRWSSGCSTFPGSTRSRTRGWWSGWPS